MKELFRKNVEEYEKEISGLSKILRRISYQRVAVFLSGIILITLFANERSFILMCLAVLVSLSLFFYLVNRFNHFAFRKRQASFLKKINEDEILRLENDLSTFDPGELFIKNDHPFSSDLDLFGKHSLFQLLNRTTTETGKICLAEWMTYPSSTKTILARQTSVKELSSKLEWRQVFQASGMHFLNAESDYKRLMEWMRKPEEILSRKNVYLVLAISLSVLSTATILFYVINVVSGSLLLNLIPMLITLFINSRVVKKLTPLSEDIIDNTFENVRILGGYQALITRIENEKFGSDLLKKLQSDLTAQEYSAAREIQKLKKILEFFQLRGTKKNQGNVFYSILNAFWLFDIYCILQAEQWKLKNKDRIESWSGSVSQFEALNSLAGFHFSESIKEFPLIEEDPYVIQFTSLGHPLITREKRILNDFNMRGRGNITMITGSNMAGKSTFLRTVGINMVLASMGAPCCASSTRISVLNIFTSMRTQDNLEEGISSFYAELKRISQLLKLLVKGEPIFFLLDEMFKGTNSADRHKGGYSLIRQLGSLNAFGIISTHDLELAKLMDGETNLKNYSFNSRIEKGDILFDYKLSPGICTDFNASELMKKSGIKIIEE